MAPWAIVRVGLGRVVVKEDREYCEKQEYNKTQRLRLDEVWDTYLLAIYQHTTRSELSSVLRILSLARTISQENSSIVQAAPASR